MLNALLFAAAVLAARQPLELDGAPQLASPLFAGPAQVQRIEVEGDRAWVIVGPGFFARVADQELAEQDRVDRVLGLLEERGPYRSIDFLVDDGRGELTPPPRRQWPPLTETLASSGRPPLWRVDPPAGTFPYGAPLAGKVVALSAGHGWIYDNGAWRTQRGRLFFDGCGSCRGILEDFSNGDLVARWLIPYLEAAGARVVVTRERELSELVDLVDDGDARFSQTGAWTAGASGGGWQDDYLTLAPGETGSARFSLQLDRSDPLLLTLRYRDGSNRTTQAMVDVTDAAGTTRYTVDMTGFGQRWLPLGVHSFVPGAAEVTILPGNGDGHLVADAVRVGGGIHDAGHPWWEMGASSYVPFAGGSSEVLARGEVTIRPAYAEYIGADAYLSIHSNASGSTGTASGTSTYRFNCLTYQDHSSDPPAEDCDDPAGSDRLQELVHDSMVARLRADWDSSWCDRGTRVANFGELRELDDTPGALVELAFHDNLGAPTCSTGADPRQGDNKTLHDPGFRRRAAYGLYEGLLEFLAPGAPAVLDPPDQLRALARDDGALELGWQEVTGARGYRVYLARGGFGFDRGQDSEQTRLLLDDLAPLETVCLRVATLNEGGLGLAGTTLCARPRMAVTSVAPAEVLLVDSFDREDPWVQEIDNRHDATRRHAEALAAITRIDVAADATVDAAVVSGAVDLTPYRVVVLAFGLESTVDRTFSTELQARLDTFRASGGALIASGAEVGWDMWRTGDSADQTWVEQVFGGSYASDDAETSELQSTGSGPLAGLAGFSFSSTTGEDPGGYQVLWPDTFTATGSGQVALQYAGGAVAAVALAGNAPGVLLGFPFETVLTQSARRDLMEALLGFTLSGAAAGDLDLDGMPDDWESQYGLDPSDASDADEDADNDGSSNLEEYQAGSDPTDGPGWPDAGSGDDDAGGVAVDAGGADAWVGDRAGSGGDVKSADPGCGCDGCGGCGDCAAQPVGSPALGVAFLLLGLWRRRHSR